MSVHSPLAISVTAIASAIVARTAYGMSERRGVRFRFIARSFRWWPTEARRDRSARDAPDDAAIAVDAWQRFGGGLEEQRGDASQIVARPHRELARVDR